MNNFDSSPVTTSVIIPILFVAIIIASLIITVLFILSQQKLAKKLSQATQSPQLNSAWLWTQLIPIVTYVSLVVTAMKLEKQTKLYRDKYSIKGNLFRANFVYWYIGFSILNIIPVINILTSVVSIILFIIVWRNISKSANKLSNIKD